MKRSASKHAKLGLTLIELLVALLIAAMLGVMAWRALTTAASNEKRLAVEFARWNAIGRFMQLTENAWLQIATRPGLPNADIVVTSNRISFIRLDGARQQVSRVGFEWRDEAIHLLRWPALSDLDLPRTDTVLSGVQKMSWRLLVVNGQTPVDWDRTSGQIPVAVELRFTTTDIGELRQLIALR